MCIKSISNYLSSRKLHHYYNFNASLLVPERVASIHTSKHTPLHFSVGKSQTKHDAHERDRKRRAQVRFKELPVTCQMCIYPRGGGGALLPPPARSPQRISCGTTICRRSGHLRVVGLVNSREAVASVEARTSFPICMDFWIGGGGDFCPFPLL